MIVLRFKDEAVRRGCCDLVDMRRRWGESRSRQISHRLQQLEAMTTVADLEFLPLDSRRVGESIVVSVDDELVILLDPMPAPSRDDFATILVVSGLELRATQVTR